MTQADDEPNIAEQRPNSTDKMYEIKEQSDQPSTFASLLVALTFSAFIFASLLAVLTFSSAIFVMIVYNVVIKRSTLVNSKQQHISAISGSSIVVLSVVNNSFVGVSIAAVFGNKRQGLCYCIS